MISAPSIQQFMLRKQRHRKMLQQKTYPSSTKSQFIIPCYQRSLGFKTNQYAKHTDQLCDYVDGVTFEGFVRAGMYLLYRWVANRIIDAQLIQKSKMENSNFFHLTSIFLKMSIVLGLFLLICRYSITYALGILTFSILSVIVYVDIDPKKQEIILVVSVVLIIVSVVIASVCPVYLYLRKYEQYNYEARVKEQLDKLADLENQKNWKNGKEYLRWSFGEGFFWAKLTIDLDLFKDKGKGKGYIVKLDQSEKGNEEQAH